MRRNGGTETIGFPPTRIGKLLGQMRLQRGREVGTGSRRWIVPAGQLGRALEAHSLPALDDPPAEK